MSGVVLRCPNCGTTRSATGECEACHEAQVRYFCSNHEPGRWLDAPACQQCGARFGDPARPATMRPPVRPSPAPAPAPAPARPTAGPRPGGGPASVPPSASARPRPRRADERAVGTGPGSPGPARGAPRPGPTIRPGAGHPSVGRPEGPAHWREALIAAARTAHRRRTTTATSSGRPEAEYPPRRTAGGGCLSRLAFMLVFIVFALLSMVMFGGGLLRVFLP